MNKKELNDFIKEVCIQYSEYWATFSFEALNSIITEVIAKNRGFGFAGQPLEAIRLICRKELSEVYNIK